MTRKAKDIFAKKKKAPTVRKFKTSQLVDTKKLAEEVKNSVTPKLVEELNAKFLDKFGKMLSDLNSNILPAVMETRNQVSLFSEDELVDNVEGFIVPSDNPNRLFMDMSRAITQGKSVQYSDDNSPVVADVCLREEWVPARQLRLEIVFDSSRILLGMQNDNQFALHIAQPVLAGLNAIKQNIGFDTTDVPYYGEYYISLTAESQKPFTLGDCNEVHLVMKTNVGKKVI
jgi:hypothetical protein